MEEPNQKVVGGGFNTLFLVVRKLGDPRGRSSTRKLAEFGQPTCAVAWTRATALFDNGGAWFFSVLLLDDVTELVKDGVPGTSACRHVLNT